MKKTVIALSIATLAAPAMAATTTLSGVVEVEIAGTDVEDSEIALGFGDVRLNVKSSTELSEGLTGYGNVRFDADNNNVTPFSDVVKVGVKGGFGDVSFGDVGSPAGKGALGGDLYDSTPGNSAGIHYKNTFAGANVGVGVKLPGNTGSDDAEIHFGADYGIAGATLGAGVMSAGDAMYASAGAGYSISGVDLGLSYETWDDGLDNDDSTIDVIGAMAGTSVADWGLTGKMYVATQEEVDTTAFELDATKDLADDFALSLTLGSTTVGEDDAVMAYGATLSKSF